MLKQITQPLDELLKNVPGVIAVMLTDIDGVPIYTNGRFDILPNRLSAFTTISYHCGIANGELLGENLKSIVADYSGFKIYGLNIGNAVQIVIISKAKESQAGWLHLAISDMITSFTQLLAEAARQLENPFPTLEKSAE